MPRKVFIVLKDGFGNKIYNLIIGLYIKYINNFDHIYTLLRKSYHETDDDKLVTDLFPNIKNYVTVLKTWEEVDTLFSQHSRVTIYCKNEYTLDDLKFNDNNKNYIVRAPSACYTLVFKMYNIIKNKYSDLFTFNKTILNKDIIKLTNDKYVTVHIRYGDKLDISTFTQKLKDRDYNKLSSEELDKIRYSYLLNSPYAYIKFINYYAKKNMKVFVVTDDVEIVENYIMSKIEQNNDVQLLDVDFVNAFYVLQNATFSFLSESSFSVLAAFLNKNLKKGFILQDRDDHPYFFKITELPSNVKIIRKNKYILNYNMDLMKEMIKSRTI